MKKQDDAKKAGKTQKNAVKKEKPYNVVDEVGEGSFPASDPPPWTLGGKGRKK